MAFSGTGYYPLTATGDVGIGNPFLGGGAPEAFSWRPNSISEALAV